MTPEAAIIAEYRRVIERQQAAKLNTAKQYWSGAQHSLEKIAADLGIDLRQGWVSAR
jgi:hypothetical protein